MCLSKVADMWDDILNPFLKVKNFALWLKPCWISFPMVKLRIRPTNGLVSKRRHAIDLKQWLALSLTPYGVTRSHWEVCSATLCHSHGNSHDWFRFMPCVRKVTNWYMPITDSQFTYCWNSWLHTPNYFNDRIWYIGIYCPIVCTWNQF